MYWPETSLDTKCSIDLIALKEGEYRRRIDNLPIEVAAKEKLKNPKYIASSDWLNEIMNFGDEKLWETITLIQNKCHGGRTKYSHCREQGFCVSVDSVSFDEDTREEVWNAHMKSGRAHSTQSDILYDLYNKSGQAFGKMNEVSEGKFRKLFIDMSLDDAYGILRM